jgi:mRNA-degrading endonuclease RelE of RelBE toxin-antitoxin system
MRWLIGNKGKRGGLRIIYYYYVSNAEILLLTIYKKSEQSDLSANDKKILKKIVTHFFEL